jgi:methylmalonyl-CoA mutase cobalamin-binding domain/chain
MDQASVELRSQLTETIEIAHVAAAESILNDYARRTSYRAALSQLLEPVLTQIGSQWNAGKPTILAQSYLAAKLTERMLIGALEESPRVATTSADFGPAIVGNIEDDFHALGRKMVSTFLQAAGWEVQDLGNDVPPETFVRAARERNARVIGVSAMMYTTATNIRRLREAIDGAGLKDRVQLAVGGAVFNLRPELVAEVGGDGSTRTAISAPGLFEALAKRSQSAEVAL